MEWPKPSSPYLKLHIATEQIGRDGEKLSKLKPPAEISDAKAVISGVTRSKGPAAQAATPVKTRSRHRESTTNKRAAALRKLVSDGGTKQVAGNNITKRTQRATAAGAKVIKPLKVHEQAKASRSSVAAPGKKSSSNVSAETAKSAVVSAAPGATYARGIITPK